MRYTLPSFLAMAALGAMSLAAAPLIAGKPAAKPTAPYVPKVTLTKAGNPVLGNPAAATKVVEYMSYACGHCAHFHGSEYKSVSTSYLATGKASLEIRPVAHNIVGIAAALAVGCSKPGYFYRTHALFLESQGTWMGKIANANAATMKSFDNGDIVSRVKAVARHAGFYEMMAGRGTTEAQLNVCLADPKGLSRLESNAKLLGAMRPGLNTPSFTIGGALVGGTGNTSALLPALGQ